MLPPVAGLCGSRCIQRARGGSASEDTTTEHRTGEDATAEEGWRISTGGLAVTNLKRSVCPCEA